MNAELTLRDYMDILRRRWPVVAVCFVGALALALVYSALQTPMYRSSAEILINQATANEIFDPVTGTSSNAADRITTNEVALIESQLVEAEAQDRLGFEADISASAQTRADVIRITATSDDPARAELVAQTYAESYLDVRRQQFVDERLDTAEQLLTRIESLQIEVDFAAETVDTSRQERLIDDLSDSYDRLTLTADLGNTGSARIITDASQPDAPFSPQTTRNLALGAVLGLMLGAGGALLLESLDTSIKSRQVLEALTPGLPTLASVPATKTPHRVIALERPDGLVTETFRTLRAGIEFASVDQRLRMIQVTSAGPAAGKTTVASNLAVVMAQAGQRVAVVDCDMRRPTIHVVFELDQSPGLSSLIIGRHDAAEASYRLDVDNGQLRVFPSGLVPPGPSELLGSDRARDSLAAILRDVDVVILDTPPVLPVADALVVSRLVDATIVVVNAKTTSRDDLVRALEQLDQAGARVIGTVLNQVKANAGHGYGYGYGYGYGESVAGAGRLFSRSKFDAPFIEGTGLMDDRDVPQFAPAGRSSAPEPHVAARRPISEGVQQPTEPAAQQQPSAARNVAATTKTEEQPEKATAVDTRDAEAEAAEALDRSGRNDGDRLPWEAGGAPDAPSEPAGDPVGPSWLGTEVADLAVTTSPGAEEGKRESRAERRRKRARSQTTQSATDSKPETGTDRQSDADDGSRFSAEIRSASTGNGRAEPARAQSSTTDDAWADDISID